jgi:2-succinyl-5-enolpyruvyl-6-hydroxy-3-cyclohexene-1-carboxylate synthase
VGRNRDEDEYTSPDHYFLTVSMRLQPIYDIAEICHKKGIEDAVLCPGSRCAPLTLSFVRHGKIRTRTVSDERSAAFIATGIAHQTSRPVVLICTSGSAAYNFAPAVAEAFYQQIPLLIITADRPQEWIGQLDGQTINQQSIYGPHVKRSFQLRDDVHTDNTWSINRDVNEALNICRDWPRGPVHLNVSLREPLYPAAGESVTFSKDIRIVEPPATRRHLPSKLIQSLTARLSASQRTLLVAGQQDFSVNQIAAVHAFSSAYRAPLIGEVISNMHALPSRVVHSDVILGAGSDQMKESLRPELLITFGKSVLSRNLKQFLRRFKPSEHWHVESGVDHLKDPFQSVTKTIAANPEDFFGILAKSASPPVGRRPYLDGWISADQKASESIEEFFTGDRAGEFQLVYDVMSRIPDHAVLHLSNSMAVRYANLVGISNKKKGIQVFANRGTSGIDGCTSTAIGHAMADESMHVLITGDMAFFYDRNAFWHNYKVDNLRIVLLNNHGGAIFGMIDGPQNLPESDEFFVTRQTRNASALASEFGIHYTQVSDNENARASLEAFFRMDGTARILEFETTSAQAQQVFFDFKDKMKKVYGAEV